MAQAWASSRLRTASPFRDAARELADRDRRRGIGSRDLRRTERARGGPAVARRPINTGGQPAGCHPLKQRSGGGQPPSAGSQRGSTTRLRGTDLHRRDRWEPNFGVDGRGRAPAGRRDVGGGPDCGSRRRYRMDPGRWRRLANCVGAVGQFSGEVRDRSSAAQLPHRPCRIRGHRR